MYLFLQFFGASVHEPVFVRELLDEYHFTYTADSSGSTTKSVMIKKHPFAPIRNHISSVHKNVLMACKKLTLHNSGRISVMFGVF